MSSHDFPSFMFLIKFVIPWDLRSFLLERGKDLDLEAETTKVDL
jgi:hypothetical protein